MRARIFLGIAAQNGYLLPRSKVNSPQPPRGLPRSVRRRAESPGLTGAGWAVIGRGGGGLE